MVSRGADATRHNQSIAKEHAGINAGRDAAPVEQPSGKNLLASDLKQARDGDLTNQDSANRDASRDAGPAQNPDKKSGKANLDDDLKEARDASVSRTTGRDTGRSDD